MALTWPRHYENPYSGCSQCGGSCWLSGSACFGGTCDYRERASSNRYDGGYPTRYINKNNKNNKNSRHNTTTQYKVKTNRNSQLCTVNPGVASMTLLAQNNQLCKLTSSQPQKCQTSLSSSLPSKTYSFSDQVRQVKCNRLLPTACNKTIAPMNFVRGEAGNLNNKANQTSSYYEGHNAVMPSYVGVGHKCDQFPINNSSFLPPVVSYQSL